MCYWFLCVPFTRAFSQPEQSSTNAEESTCHWRGFLIFCNIIGYIVLFAIVAALQVLLCVTLFLSGGHFRYTGGWFLLAILSASIIITIPTLVSFGLWLKRKPIITPTEQIIEMGSNWSIGTPVVKSEVISVDVADNENQNLPRSQSSSSFVRQCCIMRLLPFYIIMILFTEVVLIFINPFDSIFPIGIASYELVVPMEEEFVRSQHCPKCPEDCDDIDERVRIAREFMKHSSVDWSKIRIAFGGLPFHFLQEISAGMAIDRGVYLPYQCPTEELLVHEFVHIWQAQSGWAFENGVSKLIRYMRELSDGMDGLYEYGEADGLRKAAEDPKATITSAFFVEQQAEIVEDYFSGFCGMRSCTAEETELLRRFSADIVYYAVKPSCEMEDLIFTWLETEDCPIDVLIRSKYYISSLGEEDANQYESVNDDVWTWSEHDISGCSSTHLKTRLKQGISSGYCECDADDDMCNLSFIDPEPKSSNCGIYEIYQWTCPS